MIETPLTTAPLRLIEPTAALLSPAALSVTMTSPPPEQAASLHMYARELAAAFGPVAITNMHVRTSSPPNFAIMLFTLYLPPVDRTWCLWRLFLSDCGRSPHSFCRALEQNEDQSVPPVFRNR